ncbi:hypothetical protein [Arthrobacter sp. B10-11]|uniref:hypothetical protein n=1 Tax=Arthrobacter sp. B10-11 TaxID=3081160 RepID=UPI002953D326|nr:hypothetical protein [Arthrobacter sp. B10-11]MDV8147251.1 hypothetical protein [Arthrobacter sp. B10-11]
MFASAAVHYDRNLKDAPTIHAKPATLNPPDGAPEPAVVIFKTRQIQNVLPLADALRLANQIADAVDAHRATAKEQLK